MGFLEPTIILEGYDSKRLLTHSHDWHRIAPNMLKSIRWFAFYFYYGFRDSVAGGGA